MRDIADELVDEVVLIDRYENDEKFGADKVSYAYRITYRSSEKTLEGSEVDLLHKKLEQKTNSLFGATVR